MVKRLVSFMMSAAIALGSILPQGMTVFASEQEQAGVSGEIEVLMNQSYESMYKYIEGFEQKYPDTKINLTYYSDYENEAGNRIRCLMIGLLRAIFLQIIHREPVAELCPVEWAGTEKLL